MKDNSVETHPIHSWFKGGITSDVRDVKWVIASTPEQLDAESSWREWAFPVPNEAGSSAPNITFEDMAIIHSDPKAVMVYRSLIYKYMVVLETSCTEWQSKQHDTGTSITRIIKSLYAMGFWWEANEVYKNCCKKMTDLAKVVGEASTWHAIITSEKYENPLIHDADGSFSGYFSKHPID